jgi:hypothetical protein
MEAGGSHIFDHVTATETLLTFMRFGNAPLRSFAERLLAHGRQQNTAKIERPGQSHGSSPACL